MDAAGVARDLQIQRDGNIMNDLTPKKSLLGAISVAKHLQPNLLSFAIGECTQGKNLMPASFATRLSPIRLQKLVMSALTQEKNPFIANIAQKLLTQTEV